MTRPFAKYDGRYDPKPPPAPRSGPPQCARGCGWINDYAEPGFVCAKCRMWEAPKEEPTEPAVSVVCGRCSGGGFINPRFDGFAMTFDPCSCGAPYSDARLIVAYKMLAGKASPPYPAPPGGTHAPGAQAQCYGCGAVHGVGAACPPAKARPTCPQCGGSNARYAKVYGVWSCMDPRCGYCWRLQP